MIIDPFDLFMEYCSEMKRRGSLPRSAFPMPQEDSNETDSNIDDVIFDYFKTEKSEVSVAKFLVTLRNTGLKRGDPRFREMIQKFQKVQRDRLQLKDVDSYDLILDRETFQKCIHNHNNLIVKALRNQLVITDWPEFCQQIEHIYLLCKGNTGGKNADYIPMLSKVNPKRWGVAVCTIDGQRMAWGDYTVPWCLQSVSKPLTYGIALHENGDEYVHNYVGHEPSGSLFNDLCLDYNAKPHNPMVNAGAIMVVSLIKSELRIADRFEFLTQKYKMMAGGEYIGFNIATFQSERENPDRNSAISYFMKANKCFPKDVDLNQTLDLYFQLCSVEVTCESAAVIAATLANGGICPLTNAKILGNRAVRDVLSLMYSCGMYDYSGQFAYQVGLPAKSGVSGGMILVIPNVMGFALWSPPLDSTGNTVRGVEFCRHLVETFNFRNYDNLMHNDSHKTDPRTRMPESPEQQLACMLYAVASGDLNSVKRYASLGFDMNNKDYDGRTALHVAASEGHAEVVTYLLKQCKAAADALDRWNHTAMDDAKLFGHVECVEAIEKYGEFVEISISDLGQRTKTITRKKTTVAPFSRQKKPPKQSKCCSHC